MKITAITCTGDRPGAMTLCERWVSGQTRQPDRWIIVDDGKAPTAPPLWKNAAGEGPIILRLPPMEGNSLARNVRAALEHIKANPLSPPIFADTPPDQRGEGEAVAFLEDDDHYAPWWLARCERELLQPGNGNELPSVVGEMMAFYYNVRHRRVFRWPNFQHASLASTVVRTELIPWMLDGLPLQADQDPKLIDWRIWDADRKGQYRANRRLWAPDTMDRPSVVGMKGMPGRAGLASGHKSEQMDQYQPDLDGSILRSLIGDDWWCYAPLYVDPNPIGGTPAAGAVSATSATSTPSHG